MSEFDLGFELEALDESSTNYPEWTDFEGRNAEIAKQMYDLIIQRRDDIKQKLLNGIDLQGKERKILAASISTSVGKNANYLTRREFPTLHRFIGEVNSQLARIKVAGSEDLSRKKSSNLQQAARIEELEAIIDKLNHEPLIDNATLSQMSLVRQENIKLRTENEVLTEKLVSFKKDHFAMTDQISELLGEIQQLKQQVRDLGGNPDPSSPLRSVK